MKGNPLIIAFLCFPFWGFSQDYKVQLYRPLAVGDQQHWAVNGVINEVTADLSFGVISNKTTEEFHYQAEGVVTIKAVDKKGQPQRLDFLVSTFTKQEGTSGQKAEFLPKHSVISCAYVDGDIFFHVDGKAPSDDTASHLRRLFQLPPPYLTMDAIWGLSKRKKVGDVWSANLELLVKQFEVFGIEVNPGLITNSMSLKSAATVDGIPSLEVEWELDVPDSKSKKSLDHGYGIEAKFREQGVLVFPQNPGLKSQHETTELIFESWIDTDDPHQKTFFQLKTKIEKIATSLSNQIDLKP
ncbi:MAG: hypothetical protein PF450_00475 [Bacteroidales bacterium]|jgi:hypothetical protein|nr:hypothetical protein [Bacteroidales bacterium]